jgi:hypothetical protein
MPLILPSMFSDGHISFMYVDSPFTDQCKWFPCFSLRMIQCPALMLRSASVNLSRWCWYMCSEWISCVSMTQSIYPVYTLTHAHGLQYMPLDSSPEPLTFCHISQPLPAHKKLCIQIQIAYSFQKSNNIKCYYINVDLNIVIHKSCKKHLCSLYKTVAAGNKRTETCYEHHTYMYFTHYQSASSEDFLTR